MAARGGTDRARAVVPKWIGWIAAVFPAILVLAGFGLLAEAINYTTEAGSTRGEVVHVSRHYGGEGGVSYTPTIRYRRDDGRIFEAETNMASSSYDYAIGERVDILYSYDDPTEVRIDAFFPLYGPGLILVIVGGLIFRVVRWVRRKVGRGAVLERVAEAIAERMQDAARKQGGGRELEPQTTDPSKSGHVHKPKPKRAPTVRRMR